MTEKTLYVCRPVVNAADIFKWAKGEGFKQTLAPEDMHVTIAYSRTPLVWPPALSNDVWIEQPNGPTREVKPLGDKGAIVLAVDSSELYRRWRMLCDLGASWDYATYSPHITLTYDGADMNLKGVEPFEGLIELGPEKFAELDEDWNDKIEETKVA